MHSETKKIKLFRVTTVAISLDILLKGQLKFLNQHFEVTGIACGKDLLQNVKEREGIAVCHVPMKRDISIFYDLFCLFLLFFIFVFKRPHIVHANTPKGSLLSMTAAWAACIPHRIYTVTGLRYQTAVGIKKKILIMMERLTCLFATKVIPEGLGVKQILEHDKITGKELFLVHNGNINGVDTTLFQKTKQLVQEGKRLIPDENKFIFLFVGRLVKDKGVEELLTAFGNFHKRHPDSKLVCVGGIEENDSPLSPEALEYLKNGEDIISTGFQKDVKPYMAVADVFVFPSYREGFPNVILQACSMELPVIATDITGSNEIITDGVNGFLVPVKSVAELEEKMELLYKNHQMREKFSKNGREIIERKFKQEEVWNALLDVYNGL